MKVIIRADGGVSGEIGTGHIRRCLLLASELQHVFVSNNVSIQFVTRSETVFGYGYSKLKETGLPTTGIGNTEPNTDAEVSLLLKENPDVIIFDRLATTKNTILALREEGKVVVSFDDIGSGAAHTNLTINALLHAGNQKENTLVGYEYVVLPRLTLPVRAVSTTVNNLLVCCGGYDHNRLVLSVLKALVTVPVGLQCNVVLGLTEDGMMDCVERLASRLQTQRDIDVNIFLWPANFSSILREADLAIISGGLTALEVMQNGVPSIGIPQYQHQAETLSRLSTRGAMCSLLPGTELESKLVESITELVFDVRKRKRLSEQALDISDGRGLERVCSVIGSLLDFRKN